MSRSSHRERPASRIDRWTKRFYWLLDRRINRLSERQYEIFINLYYRRNAKVTEAEAVKIAELS